MTDLTEFTLLNSSARDFHDDEVVEEWSVWNDPDFFEPRFASGEVHPALRDKILGEPMFVSAIPGAAKRFLLWTNENRAMNGKLSREGAAILRMKTISSSARRKVTGEELNSIDEGRKANG